MKLATIVCIVLLVSGLIITFTGSPIGILLILIALVLSMVMVIKKKKSPVSGAKVSRPTPAAKPVIAAVSSPRISIAVNCGGKSAGGSGGEYHYDNVDVCILKSEDPDLSGLCEGDEVDLIQEPENDYDQNAVAVCREGSRFGYLYRGRMQSMVNDYIRRGDNVSASVSSVSDGKVNINIDFSRNP